MFNTYTVHIYCAPPTLAHTLDNIVTHLNQLTERITMNQAELAQVLSDLKTQADKARAEIVANVAALEAAVAASGTTSAAVDEAIAALRGSLQGLDDLNPDAPAGEVVAP